MKKKIIGISIIAVLVGGVGFYINSKSTAVEVNTAQVVQGDIAKYVEELGVIKPRDRKSVV